MIHKFEGWAKAPEGTTHFCTQDCGSPWLKVDDKGFLWYNSNGRWERYYRKAAGHHHMDGAIARPKKRAKAKAVAAYKPLKVGEKLTIENFRTTRAYKQVKRFISNNKATPYQQGKLVKLFLEEYNNCQKGDEAKDWRDQFNEDQWVIRAFDWEKSKHKFNFWSAVHGGLQVDNLGAVLGGNPAKQEDKPGEAEVLGGFVGIQRRVLPDELAVLVPKALEPVKEVKQEEPKPKGGKVGWW